MTKNMYQLEVGDRVKGMYLGRFPYQGVIVNVSGTCDYRGETFMVRLDTPALVWGEPRATVNVSNHPARQTSTIEHLP